MFLFCFGESTITEALDCQSFFVLLTWIYQLVNLNIRINNWNIRVNNLNVQVTNLKVPVT